MNKPRITSTASAQFVYEDPRAALTRPDHFASLSHYFIANWLPGITPNGLKILVRLRSLGYYQPKTGVQRSAIDIDQTQLAKQCGMGLRTLQRIFADDPVFAKYVQREFQVERDRQQRIIREHYVYMVKMDDVLTPEDEAKIQEESGDKNRERPGLEPIRQNDVSETFPMRQNDVSECQNGGPIRQNGISTRQNGVSNKESLTLLTKENTSLTATAAPRILTSSLFQKEPDILDNLSADQWATLEAEARAHVIAETADPVRQLARDGKAWTSVKPMMRRLLNERQGENAHQK